jgi:hypothetical protein
MIQTRFDVFEPRKAWLPGSGPAADVRENAIHVSDYSGQTGHFAAAALADMAEHWAFMTHILQHTNVQLPPVQSAPPLALQAAIVPAIQAGPPLPSFGPSRSPLRPVTLDFSSPVISSVSAQPPVPLAPAVTTAVAAVSVTTSAPAAPTAQPQSESVPALASTTDPRSETDSNPQLAFALLPRPRPDAPPPPPSSSGLLVWVTLLVFDAKGGEL